MSDAQYNATKDRNLAAAQGLGSLYNQTGALNLSAQQAKDAAFNNDRSAQLAATTALGSQYNADNATALNGANGAINSQLSALGLVPGMTGAQLSALQTAGQLPYVGVNNYANLVNGLTAKYGNQSSNTNSTTTQSQSLGSVLGGIAGTALGGLAGGMGMGLGSSLLGGMGGGMGSLVNPMAGNIMPQLTLGNSILGNAPLKQLSL
jgi:hypothetical protein